MRLSWRSPADGAGEAGWLGLLQNNQATLDSVALSFLASGEYSHDLAVGLR